MSIIIPDSIDEKSVRVPMQFPLRPDGDSVLDAEGRTVFTMEDSIAIRETIQFANLFAKAPEMFEALRACYGALAVVALNTEGFTHGDEDEQDKDNCLLCSLETLLGEIK